LHRCPILREPDGLAMSSRNMRLTPEQRQKATVIYKALLAIRSGWQMGHPQKTELIATAIKTLEQADFRVDYIEIADHKTLEPIDGGPGAVALIAAFLGEVRLIDNMMLSVEPSVS
jgi:pantoate--beta-alanine ligase